MCTESRNGEVVKSEAASLIPLATLKVPSRTRTNSPLAVDLHDVPVAALDVCNPAGRLIRRMRGRADLLRE
jgi:hypothetical protein